MQKEQAMYTGQEDSIRAMVASAANVASPVWPLKTFIACNPLHGFEELSFEQAVAKGEEYKAIHRRDMPEREAVNREMIKWLAAFLDEGQATLRMPGRARGFYRAFSDLAPLDRRLANTPAAWLASLPQTPEKAIAQSLERLHVPAHSHEEFIRQQMAALPGWSGYVKWRDQWQSPDQGKRNPITLVDYIAVRLILTCALWPQAQVFTPPSSPSPAFPGSLSAKETDYRRALLGTLLPEAKALRASAPPRPTAQMVFCIDVRSEPLRRSIEATGHYQTLGFAGFFGLPVTFRAYDDEESHDSCPVLITPCHEVCEYPAERDAHAVRRHDRGRGLVKLPKTFYQALKYHFATPFALVEMLGPWLGIRMLARTFAPRLAGKLKQTVVKGAMPDIATELSLEGISPDQQADYGEAALRTMGLTENIAPLVVFCGHGSSTHNNAYAAALDCGACGGNHGGGNARTLASMLNKDAIRSLLAARGLALPEDTLFLAAEHDTTTGRVTLYGAAGAQASHGEAIEKLRSDLEKASASNAALRCEAFGFPQEQSPIVAAVVRSQDWAQPRPEWGLARNAAFIVGPRALTRNVNLEGRCFLHSYDWKNDPDGAFLHTILTAPMVVAQWINSQYLFSTVDNVSYGGGSKVTKNVTGKIGIMQGNASDLMHGLPLQSVYATDDEAYHEPLRLLTIVYAPRPRITALIERTPVLQKLFGKGWVQLSCIEPAENNAYLLHRDFTWQKIL